MTVRNIVNATTVPGSRTIVASLASKRPRGVAGDVPAVSFYQGYLKVGNEYDSFRVNSMPWVWALTQPCLLQRLAGGEPVLCYHIDLSAARAKRCLFSTRREPSFLALPASDFITGQTSIVDGGHQFVY